MKITIVWLISRTTLIFLLLSLPILDSVISTKRTSYHRASTAFHPKFAYIYEQIYEKQGNLDYLFLGSSGVWTSVDAKLIQTSLNQTDKLKQLRVENFAHNFLGIDLQFLILKDVLSKKRIKHLFLELPIRQQNEPHRVVRYLWNNPEDLITSFEIYKNIYAEKSLESFRNILYSTGALKEKKKKLSSFEKTNGTLKVYKGYESREDPIVTTEVFEEIQKTPTLLSLKEVSFTLKHSLVEFEVVDYFSDYQLYFLKEILSLVEQNNIDFCIFISPRLVPDKDKGKLQIMISKDQKVNDKLKFLGVPVAKLFKGLNKYQTRKFFYNYNHLNANGSEYFSKSIIPALKEMHE